MKTQDLTIFLRSDLVTTTHPEDGSTLYACCWYAVAEDKDGNRWAHHHSFGSTTTGCSTTDRAPEKAVRFLDRVLASKSINIYQWMEIDPRYGSPAYVATC